MGLIRILATRDYRILGQENLIKEDHMVEVFKGIHYNEWLINKFIHWVKGRTGEGLGIIMKSKALNPSYTTFMVL